jgi:hypothetical protein
MTPDPFDAMMGPQGAQSAPDVDAVFDAMLESPKGNGNTPLPMKSAYDPSAGGGTLQFGPFNTGIATPQWLDRTLAGAGQGMTDLVRHAGNLVGLQSDQDLADAKQIDAPLMDTTAGKVGSFIGQSAALAPLGMGVGAALGRMGALGARLAASPIASGMIQGTAQGTIMADPGQRLQGAGVGALAGGLLPAIAGGIGKLVSGVTRTPEAQSLLDRGIDLTMGQMNPTGMANRMEQAGEGAFGIGDLIQNARDAPMQQYSRVMLNDAMPPGQQLQSASHDFNDLISEASQKFDNAYDNAKGFPVGAKIMQVQGPDVPLTKALQQVANKPRIGLTADARSGWGQQLTDQLQETINAARRSGGMQSDDLIAFRSSIRDAIRGEKGLDNASRASKGLLQDAQDKVTQSIESQLPTDVAAGLRATDQQYSRFATIRNAAISAKDAPGGPSRFQISSAIAKSTPPNAYAQGAGAGRDLSKAAASTFQNNVPRTGLAGIGRLALPAAALAPIAMTHPLVLAPLAASAALNLTAPGRRALAGNTAWQKALQGGLMGLQNQIPQQIQNLPGLYGRAGLMSAASPRLQQMNQ